MVDALARTIPFEAPPRSFAALMELYENNYLFIRRLLPAMQPPERPPEGAEQWSVQGGAPLIMRLLERSPYTTTLQLTHTFTPVIDAGPGEDSDEVPDALPDLTIRVYHDARVAEVLAVGGSVITPGRTRLETRWSVNRFLQRWLHFCLREGHQFA